ncbi:MAG: hypothetical protein ACLVJ6_00945 [Merdibacter sp.]
MKIWMMTGCSSGLGKQLMLEALKRGDRVAACAPHRDAGALCPRLS